MAKEHIVLVAKGTRAEKVALRSLTYLGKYKGGGFLYGDLGLSANWKAYQRERTRLGLPLDRD